MRRVLFLCARNRLRSPTAEAVFSNLDGVEVTSAGIAPDAECQVSADLLEWADVVFVMELSNKRQLERHFSSVIKNKRVISLDIQDRYGYMQPELISLLKAKVLLLLGLA